MGSGIVGFNIAPQHAIFTDINPYVIEFYRQIQDGTITAHRVQTFLEQEGKKLENGDAEYYYAVRERFNANHDPLDFLFLNRSCFNGVIRFNRNGQFNVPYGPRAKKFSETHIAKITAQVQHVENLFRTHDWQFLCQPFENTIAMADKNDFIYCDPPYLGRNVNYYDMWNVESETKLHEALTNSRARFMLSTWHHDNHKENECIKNIWSECSIITQDHFYKVGAKKENRNPVVEAILTNYKL